MANDPVDEQAATLPAGWRGRVVNLPPGETDGVKGLCLEPHDLVLSKYVARREKDLSFNRGLVVRGIVKREMLLTLLAKLPVERSVRARILADIVRDFGAARKPA